MSQFFACENIPSVVPVDVLAFFAYSSMNTQLSGDAPMTDQPAQVSASIPIEEIRNLIKEHTAAPHMRLLQKRLAAEVTVMVHTKGDLETAMEASDILFGKGTTDTLRKLDEETFLAVFEGVPLYEMDAAIFDQGISLAELLAVKTDIFASKGELRRMTDGGALSINKEKTDNPDRIIAVSDLLNKKYLLVQKGRKNYYLIKSI